MKNQWEKIATRGKRQCNLLMDLLTKSIQNGYFNKFTPVKSKPTALCQFDCSRWMLKNDIEMLTNQIQKNEQIHPGFLFNYTSNAISELNELRRFTDNLTKQSQSIQSLDRNSFAQIIDTALNQFEIVCGSIYQYIFINRFIDDEIAKIITKKIDPDRINEAKSAIYKKAFQTEIGLAQTKLAALKKHRENDETDQFNLQLNLYLKDFNHLTRHNFLGKQMELSDVLHNIENFNSKSQLQPDKSHENILSTIDFSESELSLIEAVKQLNYFPQHWDESTNYFVQKLMFIWQKAADLVSLPYLDLIELTKDEILASILDPTHIISNKNRYTNRKNNSVFLYMHDDIEILTQDEFKKNPVHQYFIFDATEKHCTLHGQTACNGISKGKVRLILKNEDLDNVQQGEIIVAVSTTPVFLLALNKTAGIITEEGGLLSHAAIISRELKIPCIVGVPGLTSTLSTGDYVTLDTESGKISVERKDND